MGEAVLQLKLFVVLTKGYEIKFSGWKQLNDAKAQNQRKENCTTVLNLLEDVLHSSSKFVCVREYGCLALTVVHL